MSTITLKIQISDEADRAAALATLLEAVKAAGFETASAPRAATKGDLIWSTVQHVVETGIYFDRNWIASEVGCTVSRIAEVLKAHEEKAEAIEYRRMADVAVAEAKAARAAKVAEAKAAKAVEVETEVIEVPTVETVEVKVEEPNITPTGREAYGLAKGLVSKGQVLSDELLNNANAWAKGAKKAQLVVPELV